ncbi:GpE family phage tail protein [Sphingomonas oryzagri]
MANLFVIFHGWNPSVCDPMPLAELMRWHALAIERLPKEA